MNLSSLFSQNRTILMGVLNVTPDSFSDGGEFLDVDVAVARAVEMIQEGADIIDIGGESTRPGAEFVTESTELDRVVPVIQKIKEKNSGIIISIDTNKAGVAEKALQAGADMVNSLGGFLFDKKLPEVIARLNCPIIMYHIHGVPKTMQTDIEKYDAIAEISAFFEEQIEAGLQNGLKKEQFILDPGIGFGKTLEQNLKILKRLSEFQKFNLHMAIGVSRKSHLGKLLKERLSLPEIPGPRERLEASLAETAVAISNGAKIVRTHDVKETKRFVTVLEELE